MKKFNYHTFNTRLYLLSILVGLFAGIFATAFRWVVQESGDLRTWMFQHQQPLWFHLAIIVGMWLVLMAVNWLKNHVPLISGSGIPQSRAVIFGRYKFKKPIIQFFSKFIGSASAIGVGLSLGREGPSVQIGTLGATIISKYIKTTPTEKRYLCSAGAGAGLSAAFTAPIASVIFLIEDTLGWDSLKVALPALIACIISGYAAHLVFAPTNVYAALTPIYPNLDMGAMLLVLIGFAILGTVGGKLFNLTLFNWQKFYNRVKIPTWIKIFAIVIFTYIMGMFILDITGGGETELIKQVMTDDGNLWWMFALVLIKILFTAFSYATGLCGSLLLPLIVMGGLLGKAYALVLIQWGVVSPETASFFTLIGMSIFFISVIRAPISGLMLTLEMTSQYIIFFPMIITGALCFLFGQYLGIKPAYHKLYGNMFKGIPKGYINVKFEVNESSPLDGLPLGKINLPSGCGVVDAWDSEQLKNVLTSDSILAPGCIINVRIPNNENYEQLFKAIRTLANE